MIEKIMDWLKSIALFSSNPRIVKTSQTIGEKEAVIEAINIPESLKKFSDPTIQSLIQSVVSYLPHPISDIASGISLLATGTLLDLRIERLESFFDELSKGIPPDQALLSNKDFLHCYTRTIEAVIRTHRQEKIRMFACLLASALDEKILIHNVDEYEEYLEILDELSLREIRALILLDKYEEDCPTGAGTHSMGLNALQRANLFWNKFLEEMEKELEIPKEEVDSFLTRLNRTGCYETIIGTYYDYSGGLGKLTGLYRTLKRLAIKEKGKVI